MIGNLQIGKFFGMQQTFSKIIDVLLKLLNYTLLLKKNNAQVKL